MQHTSPKVDISPERPDLLDRWIARPPVWAVRAHRAAVAFLPAIVAAYGLWYDALADGVPMFEPDLVRLLVFPLVGAAMYGARRFPTSASAAALACWSLTGSAIFVMVMTYVLVRWRPRVWWAVVAVFAVAHPLGLVPDPCAYRAGHTVFPTGTVPLFAVLTPGLLGAVVALTVRVGRAREQRALAEAETSRARAATTIARERLRMSQDMHDILGQRLSRMVLQASAIAAGTSETSTRDLADRIADTGAETVEDLRYVVDILWRGDRTDDPVATCDEAVRRAREDGHHVEVRGLDDVPDEHRALTAAVVGEALHNATKYAPGAVMSVEAVRTGTSLRVCVVNGPTTVARAQHVIPGGAGLALLRRRAVEVDGTVRTGPTPDGGFRVELEVPR